jgi:hypothetical protein
LQALQRGSRDDPGARHYSVSVICLEKERTVNGAPIEPNGCRVAPLSIKAPVGWPRGERSRTRRCTECRFPFASSSSVTSVVGRFARESTKLPLWLNGLAKISYLRTFSVGQRMSNALSFHIPCMKKEVRRVVGIVTLEPCLEEVACLWSPAKRREMARIYARWARQLRVYAEFNIWHERLFLFA